MIIVASLVLQISLRNTYSPIILSVVFVCVVNMCDNAWCTYIYCQKKKEKEKKKKKKTEQEMHNVFLACGLIMTML